MVADLRQGWRYFSGTTWLWVVVGAFAVLNALHSGAIQTLGPVLATASDFGASGWGLALSAEAVGLLCFTVVMLRVRLERPLLWGMIGCAFYGVPMLTLGLTPHLAPVMVTFFLAGAGAELFGLAWNLAVQERVPQEMLSRVYSYDALGSFVAIPLGQLAAGPLALVFGTQHTILVAGAVYVVICLATLGSRSVRNLQRAEPAAPSN